jgi:hypothetical protein
MNYGKYAFTILCIQANSKKLYHLGIGSAISKSTLSKANENRDWRIYQDFALLLIAQAKLLYNVSKTGRVKLTRPVC